MTKKDCFLAAVKERRSCYELKAESPVSDEEIIEGITQCLKYAPSSFNSQGTRVLVLFAASHRRFWQLVRESLQKIVPAENFAGTDQKIASFAAAYGTVLFFEDWETVSGLQQRFPTYAENFPVWAYQANGMAELLVWIFLRTVGLGASLQHYNPLVDEAVKQEFLVPSHWKLVAQMPFGISKAPAGEKSFLPSEMRVKILQ